MESPACLTVNMFQLQLHGAESFWKADSSTVSEDISSPS